MIARTVASVFTRQSPSSLIFSSINAEADSTGTGLFMYTSNSRAYFSCAQRNLVPPGVEASSGSIAVRKDGGNPRAGLIGMIEMMLNDDYRKFKGRISAHSHPYGTFSVSASPIYHRRLRAAYRSFSPHGAAIRPAAFGGAGRTRQSVSE